MGGTGPAVPLATRAVIVSVLWTVTAAVVVLRDCHVEYLDAMAALDAVDSGREASPPGADDSDLEPLLRAHRACQFVRIAIQTLRSGVSDTRWCRTWKPPASISRSNVR